MARVEDSSAGTVDCGAEVTAICLPMPMPILKRQRRRRPKQKQSARLVSVAQPASRLWSTHRHRRRRRHHHCHRAVPIARSPPCGLRAPPPPAMPTRAACWRNCSYSHSELPPHCGSTPVGIRFCLRWISESVLEWWPKSGSVMFQFLKIYKLCSVSDSECECCIICAWAMS